MTATKAAQRDRTERQFHKELPRILDDIYLWRTVDGHQMGTNQEEWSTRAGLRRWIIMYLTDQMVSNSALTLWTEREMDLDLSEVVESAIEDWLEESLPTDDDLREHCIFVLLSDDLQRKMTQQRMCDYQGSGIRQLLP